MNNNNRGNTNRRRGRGGNRQQGSAQQINRIDSRARGNAPQMLEKYRKLAHDAHLNGDRVQEESFLQFADHYFRVIADQRQRQEDQRSPRREWQEGGENDREDSEDGGEYGGESEYQPYGRQPFNRTDNRTDRDERPREPRQREERVEEKAPAEDSGEAAGESNSPFEPAENPFVREPRGPRGLRPRREDRRPRRDDASDQSQDEATAPRGLDPAILPPPISAQRAESESEDVVAAPVEDTEAAAPRRRTRRPRPAADEVGDADETLKAAS